MADPTSTLAIPTVLDGIDLSNGLVNVADTTILDHVRHSIRLGYPQVKAQPPQMESVILVGGGPSLEGTLDQLRDLYFAGAKIVTVNGSYRWCLERNLRPSAQIVLDARPENARFLEPAIPHCHYLLASQCHPETWATVRGRDNVWIWHAVGPDKETEETLSAYYVGRWRSIGHGPIGGTTVVMRALALLRTLGYLRFDLFGVDSCVLGDEHHAYTQSENDRDRVVSVTASPTGHPEYGRTFRCTAWHLKQLEDFLQIIRVKGSDFLLNVHGPGLLAYVLQASADVEMSISASGATE